MNTFKFYFKQKIGFFVIMAVFVAIFLVSFVLYRLPPGAVAYPALVCAVIGICCFFADFYFVNRKCKKIAELRRLPSAVMEDFPPADGAQEQQYLLMSMALRDEIAQLEKRDALRLRDMTEYYTAWVHQIKTPISSMRLTLQNEDTPLGRKLSSDLFRIEQYAEMALAFSRLDSDSSDYVFREYRLDSIISQCVAKFASEFIDRKIRLNYKPVEKQVVTDEKWLCFVLEQVLSNALKYTQKGSITIFMPDSDTLCVRDTGIGILPEDLPRVFEKGYTGCNGRRDKRASGIGLYLCRRICCNLGADISINSVPDQGTDVFITIKQPQMRVE